MDRAVLTPLGGQKRECLNHRPQSTGKILSRSKVSQGDCTTAMQPQVAFLEQRYRKSIWKGSKTHKTEKGMGRKKKGYRRSRENKNKRSKYQVTKIVKQIKENTYILRKAHTTQNKTNKKSPKTKMEGKAIKGKQRQNET